VKKIIDFVLNKIHWIIFFILGAFASQTFNYFEKGKREVELKELIKKQEKTIQHLKKDRQKVQNEIENLKNKIGQKRTEIESLNKENEKYHELYIDKKVKLEKLKNKEKDLIKKDEKIAENLDKIRAKTDELLKN